MPLRSVIHHARRPVGVRVSPPAGTTAAAGAALRGGRPVDA